MRYIKAMSLQKLSLLLAVYIGWFMNYSVLVRRFEGYLSDFSVEKGIFIGIELVSSLLVTFFLFRLLSLGGRRLWKVLATAVVLISAGASYYMTNLNVVIGYGIIASVMTTDVDLSKEVVGWHFISWLVLTSIIPLIFIWFNQARDTLLNQLLTSGQRLRGIGIVLLCALLVWCPFA